MQNLSSIIPTSAFPQELPEYTNRFAHRYQAPRLQISCRSLSARKKKGEWTDLWFRTVQESTDIHARYFDMHHTAYYQTQCHIWQMPVRSMTLVTALLRMNVLLTSRPHTPRLIFANGWSGRRHSTSSVNTHFSSLHPRSEKCRWFYHSRTIQWSQSLRELLQHILNQNPECASVAVHFSVSQSCCNPC